MKQNDQKLIIFTPEGSAAQMNEQTPKPTAVKKLDPRLTGGEKLLRNSALACALLLGIMSLKNIDHPIAQNAATAVTKAITLDFDVDETLGELQFVRRFLPESALVFWNLSDSRTPKKPVEGRMIHTYTEVQPWYLFSAEKGTAVFAAKSGTVQRCNRTDAGDYEITVSHHDGTCSIYAYVQNCRFSEGDPVKAGEVIAEIGMENTLYYEYQRNGKSISVDEFAQ